MEPNHDNEKRWTNVELNQEIEGLKRYIRAREKRWVHEDTKRDAFREWQRTQVSAEERERLLINWTRSDNARIKYRVEARKKSDDRLEILIKILMDLFPGPPYPPPCKCAKEDAETAKRRKKEDERLEKSRFKEDTLKARKRKAQDDRIAKKRHEQDTSDTFNRNNQDDEIAARRACEDKERHELHKKHAPGTEC
jgi:hypothetical protein